MFTKNDARELIFNLFEEEALMLGGLIATHDVEDDFVWRLIKNLDVLRGRTLRQIEDQDSPCPGDELMGEGNMKPHPAIEDFLLKLRRA